MPDTSREADARLLEHRAVAQDARRRRRLRRGATCRGEGATTIHGFDRRGQLIVQAAQVPRDVVYW